jgi:hypothetical protein
LRSWRDFRAGGGVGERTLCAVVYLIDDCGYRTALFPTPVTTG